ncbi:hypothetical protein ACFTQ7_12910 [Lysinibacillus sp. NPDC056959]|uniref:hypothetical protein n=1 Tax=Lysinibacillus sp. NPDC056959 TaxID=3345981 RepID=UPI00362F244E
MQQLSIFDYPADSKHEAIQQHVKVKLKLLDESIDCEIHNYRKYYCNHLIGKVGFVLEVNKNTVEVQFAEETVLCEVSELEWIA